MRGGRARDVVTVVGVAAVDDHVAGLESITEVTHGLLRDLPCGNHHPHGPRLGEPGDELVERSGTGRSLGLELVDLARVDVEDDAVVTGGQQPPCEVRAHSSESDHSELHWHASVSLKLGQDSSDRIQERRPCLASVSKSPRACASLAIPNVYACSGTGRSTVLWQVICRNTPELGLPL